MSNFVQQNATICDFRTTDSWVILSSIEQSIKRKIEAVGTPLKDWDIQINYGIKTGFNDAFIISTEKRNEILDNCFSDEERQRTAELIRPILRGRDIKRYGYDWANLWLINTHNGVKGVMSRVDIMEYPALKAHLDQHWDKISKRAENLVKEAEKIEKTLGIPIVNKRISVTPIAQIASASRVNDTGSASVVVLKPEMLTAFDDGVYVITVSPFYVIPSRDIVTGLLIAPSAIVNEIVTS